MSNLINKAKAAISGDKHATNAGPHDSNLANKADPRVDSDMDHRANPAVHTTGTHSGYAKSPTTTTTTQTTTTAGPHNSNLLNKMDPRVDSDMNHRDHPTHTTMGSANTGYTTGPTGTGAGLSSTHGSNNAGPHNSNIMNKIDPRVDSDMDHRANPTSHTTMGGSNTGYATGTTGVGYGSSTTHGSTNAGPHNSNLMNELDPRVDSDMDHRHNPTGTMSTTGGHTGYATHTGTGHHGTHSAGYGPSTTATAGMHGSTNAGPHNSNLMNKLDPRVDSDMDHRANPSSGFLGTGTSAGYGASTTADTGYNSTGPGVGHTAGTHHHGAGNHPHGAGTHHHGTTGASQKIHQTTTAPGSGTTQGTAGPHNSNLLNKLDPRVDSDLDGRKTYGGNAT